MTTSPTQGLHTPRSAGANTLVMVVGHIVSRALLMLAFMAAARALGPLAFGQINVALGVLAFLGLAADPGLFYVAQRRLAADPTQARGLVTQVNRLRCGLALAALAATGLVYAVMRTNVAWLVWVYALSLLPSALSLAWIHSGREQFSVVALSNVISAVVYGAWILIFVRGPQDLVYVPLGLVAANASSTIAQYLMAPPAWWRTRFANPLPKAQALLRDGLSFGTVLFLAQSLVWIDSFLLLVLLDARAVGIYHAAYRWILFTVGLAAYFPQVLFPRLLRLGQGHESATMIANATRLTLALGCGCTFAFFGSSTVFIASAFGSTYAAAESILRVLCLLIPFAMHNALAVHCLNARHKERTSVRITIVAVVLNVLANIALIPRFGAWGAAWALVITEGTIAILCGLALVREGISFVAAYRSLLLAAAPALSLLALRTGAPAWRAAGAALLFVFVLFVVGDARPARLKQLYRYFSQ